MFPPGYWQLLGVLGLVLSLVGCSAPEQVGLVSGQVTDAKGEPLDSVRVYFMPDFDKGGQGGASWAITDEQGNYQLEYQNEAGKMGALLGWHRITLQDLAGENFRGSGPPPAPRVPPIYMDPSGTPLTFEVAPGEQVVDLQLK